MTAVPAEPPSAGEPAERGRAPAPELIAAARAEGTAVAPEIIAAARAEGAAVAPEIVAAARAEGTAAAPTPRRLTLRNYAWLIVGAAVLLLLLHWLGPVLTPFLVGAILAYLGTPIVDRAAAHGVPRGLGTLAVVLAFGFVLFALFVVLVPLVQSEVSVALQRLPDLLSQLEQRVGPWLQERFGVELSLDLDTVRSFVAENAASAQELSLKLLSGVRAGSRIVLGLLVNAALIPVVMFYMLRDWWLLIAKVDDLIPRRWRPKAREIARDIDSVLAEFLRGQLMVMAVLAIYYAGALAAVGLDRAVAIGLLTGLLIFIPYVGFGLGFLLGTLAALLQWHGWPGFLAVLAVYLVGQLLENYVLVPYLVGDRIGLHPLAVIFALLAFGQLFGFAGVLLALPISAALLVGLRQLRAAYVDSPVYHDG